jgi:hypothetical protein
MVKMNRIPNTQNGRLMYPKTVKKELLQEDETPSSTTKSGVGGSPEFISCIPNDHTVLANAVQNACVGMWYPTAEKREGERSFDCITYRGQEQCVLAQVSQQQVWPSKEARNFDRSDRRHNSSHLSPYRPYSIAGKFEKRISHREFD